MPGRLAVLAVAVALLAAAAEARQRGAIDPTPFAHAPCGVLDDAPCTPSTCNVFQHCPCIPEIDYPNGQNLRVTILSVPARDDAAKYHKPDHDLDIVGDLFAAPRSC